MDDLFDKITAAIDKPMCVEDACKKIRARNAEIRVKIAKMIEDGDLKCNKSGKLLPPTDHSSEYCFLGTKKENDRGAEEFEKIVAHFAWRLGAFLDRKEKRLGVRDTSCRECMMQYIEEQMLRTF